ncbi:hypothetical protein FM038_004685 [Shewanella eurypsychrophilus]|uniref:Tetratricopeptide repeat protein n=1 Tax=Shewanella eurypsychrophilus TaxID=2593656 RepID=A0ABX6V2F0_9GAMM|nr:MULTISPECIES: hypothetical protein [Shewanella]QFU21512.1 hypothetical protein FS418_06265 [Shewanella sp. YLB-09]QPG56802.1 hypothetical protein FM038_004685 [Shewanella eurypsychrophilus]
MVKIRLVMGVIWLFVFQGCSATSEPKQLGNIEQYFYDEHFEFIHDLPAAENLLFLPDTARKEIKNQFRRDTALSSNRILAHEWLASYIDAENGGFEYRDNTTRTAGETYSDRAGNCMSLVLLTAAIADEIGVDVEFQDIEVPPVWDKQGNFYLINGHVNLKLLPRTTTDTVFVSRRAIQVDFLPERAVRAYSKIKVDKQTVLAMYYNNVAAESLVIGEYDRAYGLLKLGIAQKPDYVPALNTLAVLYRYKGLDQQAEILYKLALDVSANNMNALYNYAILLGSQGRLEEWAEIHKVLELDRIGNPYYYYDMAQQAYFDREYQDALLWYKRAVDKADYRHEFYFGLSRAYWATGDERRAKKNMQKALSLTRDENSKIRYQAKLHAMKSH